MGNDRLKDEVALITGATRGIGEAVVRRCAQTGCKVVFTGRNESNGKKIESEIRDAGGDAMFFRADVGSPEEVEASVDAAVSRFGGLTVLVNNAAPTYLMAPQNDKPPVDRLPPEMSLEDWELCLKLMLTGPTFLTCKYGVPELIKAGHGSVIQISSTQSIRATASGVGYTAAKAAQNALMRHLALHYAKHKIRCNSLALGYFPGPSTEQAEGLDEIYRQNTPLGSGEGDDLAYLVIFLASPESRWITGETIVIDGGLTTWLPGNHPVP